MRVSDLFGKSYSYNDFIFFWKHRSTIVDEHCLSQWWDLHSFVEDDIVFNCAEKYMMYHKALTMGDISTAEEILAIDSPADIKKAGRKVYPFDADLWDKAKFDVVVKGNFLKFSQNKLLRWYLLSTADKILVEASPRDQIWGIGMSKQNPSCYKPEEWRGQNLLGFALMEVRDMLK